MTATTYAPDAATKARADRNLDLLNGYIQAQLDDPHLQEQVPDGAMLVLLPADDPETYEANLSLALSRVRKGDNVYIRHVSRDGAPLPAVES
jgi:hypothetical protein